MLGRTGSPDHSHQECTEASREKHDAEKVEFQKQLHLGLAVPLDWRRVVEGEDEEEGGAAEYHSHAENPFVRGVLPDRHINLCRVLEMARDPTYGNDEMREQRASEETCMCI